MASIGGSLLSSQGGNAAAAGGQIAGKQIGGAVAATGLVSGATAGAIGKVAGKAVGKAGLAAIGALNEFFFGSGRQDPDIQFCFWLEFDNIQWAKFREANGIEWSVKTESFSEGGNNSHQVNLIGQGSFKPLVLKKGFYAGNSGFYNMMYNQMESPGAVDRANISLVITSENGDEVGRYDFKSAYVSRYKGPSFNAKQSDIAFEEIEITYDWFIFHPGDALTSMLDALIGAGISAATKALSF